MDIEEDEATWDGPNIRPPQQARDSGNRSKSANDRKHHSSHRRPVAPQSSQRHSDHGSSRHSSSRSSTEKHGFSNRSDHRSSRNYKPQRVVDLRERLSGHRSDSRGHESSRDRPSNREKGWPNRSRERELDHRTRKSGSINDESHDLKRHDKIREEKSRHSLEKKASSNTDKRLKREHSKEKDNKPAKIHRPDSNKSSKHVEVLEIEESSEEEEEEEEEDESKNDSADNEASESGESTTESGDETEGESGEIESSSESGDETGSEQTGDTPEHNVDEEEEENIGSDEEEVNIQYEKNKNEQGGNRLSNSKSETDEERSPSRSPSPNRKSAEKDEHSNHKEGTPKSTSSFADNLEQENEEVKEDAGTTGEPNQDADDDNADEDDSLPVYLPSVHGCRSVEEFQCLNRIEEGTYGVVYRAKDKRTNKIVALKRLKMEREKEGFPITSLREINTLLISQHPNVVTVREIVVGSNMDKIYIVMDFVEHDMKSLMETMRQRKHVFLPGEVKCLMQQLLRAIAHLHDNWILHRDLKTSNLLLSHNGILKVGDFGLAREYGSPLKPYTPVVVTLWYRAPELLLGLKEYSTHIDVWSIGCIFGEFLLMEPMFPGKGDMDQLSMIFKLLGTPTEKNYPYLKKLPVVQRTPLPDCQPSNLRNKFSKDMLTDTGLAFLKSFLNYDHTKRFTCEEALLSDYFKEQPRAIDPRMFPTWPAKSELSGSSGQAKKGASPKPPSGGGAFKKINEDEEAYTGFVLNPGPSAAPAPWNLRF